MKYYIKINEKNIITAIGSSKKIPANSIQISKKEYDEYKAIMAAVPRKDGYKLIITLYVDKTCIVEYVPEVIPEEE